MVEVFREVRRVLHSTGVVWLNMGDSYCSDAGVIRQPTTLDGPRVPSGWTNRAQPMRVHAIRASQRKFRLRKGLTPEQQSYVLTEIAKARRNSEATKDGSR